MEGIKTFFRILWIHIRWFISAIPVNLFGLLTSFFMFPVAWVFRGLGKWSPFWIWMDDGRITQTGYASDYQVFLGRKGLEKENFKIAYYWMVSRNRVINFRSLFKVPSSKFKKGTGNNNIPIPKTLSAYKEQSSRPDTMVLLLTGRHAGVGKLVTDILNSKGLKFNDYIYKTGNLDTADFKIEVLDKLVNNNPILEEIEIWEDRDDHLPVFQDWASKQKLKVIVHHITDATK